MKPTWFDRLVTLNSPRLLTDRLAARAQLEYLQRSVGDSYEAAGGGRRFTGWGSSNAGPNSHTVYGLDTLRARHRELIRNNPWCFRAKQAIVAHSVGHGIAVEIKGGEEGARKQVNELWRQWFETTKCDAYGTHDGYGLQALMMGTVVEAGSTFVRARWRRPGDKLPVPLQLQVIEPDYCDHLKNGELDRGRIVQGIEFDTLGRRRGYWMYREHPNDYAVVARGIGQSQQVPASEIAHIYRVDRPGQIHGIPWGVAAFMTLKDLDGFEDAYLFRQKLANCFVGTVHDVDGPSLGATSAQKAVLPDSMEPGGFMTLPAGKKVTFNTPPSAGDYGPFTLEVLRRVAQVYGLTFQTLTGDLTKVNFTSGRMGWIDMARNIETWRWHMFVPQGLEVIVRWFLEAVELQYGIDTSAMFPECTPPRREMLAPQIEVPAEIKAIRGGLQSLKESHRSRGVRFDAVVQEIAESNAALDAAGIVLDSDPRKVSQVGNASDPTGKAGSGEGKNSERDDDEDGEEGA